MLNTTAAFTFIEFLIVIAIVMILSIGVDLGFNKFLYMQHANVALQQLQMALNYARSIAILTHANVTVCPSTNKVTCGGAWQQGVLVLGAQGQSRFFQLSQIGDVSIVLFQSGYLQQSVRIHNDGMTYTNGHFTYISANSRYIPRFNLYFNRGLRTYVRVDRP